jgi:hypothetical protein
MKRPVQRPVDELRRFGGGSVGAFGEMLVIGLVITALSLPLVTAVPALAAGTRHLERHLAHKRDSIRDLLSLGWQAIRSGWLFGLASLLVIVLLLINVELGARGAVPGGGALAVVSGVLAAAVAVLVTRVASLWEPGSSWTALWRSGRMLALTDPIGSGYVLAGLAVGAVIVWMLPPLIVIAPGLLAVALVAAERRRRCTEKGNA